MLCLPAQSIPASPRHSCPATAACTPVQACSLPFCGQALQTSVENVGLSTHEACPAGPGQASVTAQEERAGYHHLTLSSVKRTDPLHVPQALAFVISKSLYPPKPVNILCQSTENCQKPVRDPTSSSRTCLLPHGHPQGSSPSLSDRAFHQTAERGNPQCTALQQKQ